MLSISSRGKLPAPKDITISPTWSIENARNCFQSLNFHDTFLTDAVLQNIIDKARLKENPYK